MHPAVIELERRHAKPSIPQVQSGDTVRVHQRIREGNKQRIQVFEGVVIRTHRMNSTSATITVRRIASGTGVEKTYLLHSPNVDKVEILRRGQVRRNFLSYLRERRGKSARLKEMSFDKAAANQGNNVVAEVASDPLADEDADAEVTEISTGVSEDELNQAEGSTDEVAKDENKEAAAEDAKPTDGGGDESVMEQEEAESKIDEPDSNN